jgi:hypothetical protein
VGTLVHLTKLARQRCRQRLPKGASEPSDHKGKCLGVLTMTTLSRLSPQPFSQGRTHASDSHVAYGVSCRVRAKSYPCGPYGPLSPLSYGSPALPLGKFGVLALQPS